MRVVVIGGGIAGLGAATYLARRGHDVEVLEAGDHVGGRAITLRRPGSDDRCDVGTQYYHSSYTRALALIRDVGLGDTVRTIRGNTCFFDDRVPAGKYRVGHRLPYMKAAGVVGNLQIAWFALSRLLRHRMSTFALEDRPTLDGAAALEVARAPAVREFLIRTLVSVGMLTDPEPARVSLLQVLRLMRIILLTDYVSLDGGVAALHQALAERLKVRLEAPVERLICEGEVVTGVALAGSGETVAADHVVVAAPPPRAAAMLPPEWEEERRFLGGVDMPPAHVITFFLDRPLEKNVWSYVIRAGADSKVTFFSDAAEKSPAMVPSGRGILQAWVIHPQATHLAHLDDDELVAVCRADLERYFPGSSSWIEAHEVTRHRVGVPSHSVGHHGRALEFLRRVGQRPHVSFCGDYLSGGFLEPALWSAERIAEELD